MIIFSFIIAITIVAKAHKGIVQADPKIPHLDFIGKPEVTCNIDGKWFKHKRVTKDGKVIIDFWHEEPRKPTVTIKAEAHGFGWAHTIFHGNINGKPFGDADNSNDKQLGFWIGISPYPVLHGDERITYEEDGTFNYSEGEYSWDGKGSIKLVPHIWKWRLGGKAIGGEWIPAHNEFHKKKNAESNGTWTVKHFYSSLGSQSNNDDDEDQEDSEEQGNANPPTIPDRPGSFELTPYKYAIKLQWTDSESNGGSDITDYQYQKQSSRSNRRNWSSWSDWISAGTGNSTWLTGLSKDTDYAVRMRAVNKIGNSSKTGIKIVKTTN